MAHCPSCRHASSFEVAHCPQCGHYLGSTADFVNFVAFWAAVVSVVGLLTILYGIVPNRRLSWAVSQVKTRDREAMALIGGAIQRGEIEPAQRGAWETEDFGGLYLVAFTYGPGRETKEFKEGKASRRMAVWWAVDASGPTTPPKIGSVDEFADQHLLRRGFAHIIPGAAREAERLPGQRPRPLSPTTGGHGG